MTAGSKKELRQLMLAKRSLIPNADKRVYDGWICQELLKLITKNGFKIVHTYLPMRGEINLYPMIEELLRNDITVVCPKTLPNRKLENRVLLSLDEIEKGVFGTLHPANLNKYTGRYDLIIVPGLAFDHTRYRLGYGGGYYDGFLAEQNGAQKIGICYPFQEVASVPIEPHDVRLDTVLINKNLSIKFKL